MTKGRPSKVTVDYFPHQTAHKKTIFTLENIYGNDGYAFWFKLLEILGSSDNHVFRYENTADWLFLVAKTRVSEEKAVSILKTLSDLGAIDSALHLEQAVWCQKFVDGLIPVYDKRSTEIPCKPTLRGEKGLKGEKNPQSKVKQSKGERSREYKPEFISVELWDALIENRTHKKLQNTPLALKTFCNSIKKAMAVGYSVEDCIGEYVSCSWARFDHTWMKKDNNKFNGGNGTQRERHNDIREQYAADLLADELGNNIPGNGNYEKLGN